MQDEKDIGAAWQARIYGAVQKRDAAGLRELAKQAGREKQEVAAPLLCNFLLPPSSRWRTPRSSKGGWPEARAAAIWALKEIGNTKTVPALVNALVRERDAMVREAARAAIQSFGSEATLPLLTILHEPVNWNIKGMKVLLECLSDPLNPTYEEKAPVIDALVQCMRNRAPLAPSRWKKAAVPQSSAAVVFVLVAGAAYFTLRPIPVWVVVAAALLVSRLAARLFYSGLPVRFSIQEQRERRELYRAASSALWRLNDKRCIPALIEVAFGPARLPARGTAQNLLAGLLPTIEQSDSGMFSASSLELLNIALLTPHEARLTLAILHALAMAGNETSIRAVKRLMRWGNTRDIMAEAGRVLGILEQRRVLMQEARSLLRGSQPPMTPSDQLLRPAAAQTDAHPEQLLRPARSD